MNYYISTFELIGLGIIAGAIPVYIGITVALLVSRLLDRYWEKFFIGLSLGILIYLFSELMYEAVELTSPKDYASWVIFILSLAISFVGLMAMEQKRQANNGSNPMFLAYMISIGLGLHNLGEGLAIGTSYVQKNWVLNSLLIGGFTLHNVTEGFGILAALSRYPLKLKDIGVFGLLAGLPTCIGTVVSGYIVSQYISIICYTLASGSLLYVVVSLIALPHSLEYKIQSATGIFSGISFMYLTGMIVSLIIRTQS